jgi:hypothetical protein
MGPKFEKYLGIILKETSKIKKKKRNYDKVIIVNSHPSWRYAVNSPRKDDS